MFKTRQTKLALVAAAMVALIAPPLFAAPEGDKSGSLSKELDSLLKDSSSLTEIGPTDAHKSGDANKTDSTSAVPSSTTVPSSTSSPTTVSPTTTTTESPNNDSSLGITPSTSEPKSETPAQVPTASAQPQQSKPSQPPAPPKAPTTYLKGRLEEIGGSGARLPVGVVLNLKTQTAKMDPAVEKKLEGRVASFPSDWTGSYGGTLTIWSAQWDPLAFQVDPETAEQERQIQAPGAKGNVSFNFFRQNNVIALAPATITFAARSSPAMAKQLEQQLQSSGLGKMFGNSGMGSIIAQMPTAIPMIVLGDQATAMGVAGNSISKRLVKNDVRQLKPNVLEQNMVVQETEQVRGTGEVRRSYTESVMRFTRMNSNQLYTQAALVNYAANGHFLSKVLLYGTVTRGQGSSMPGFPGAFPGMPASGTGGFGDLNNMLKQFGL